MLKCSKGHKCEIGDMYCKECGASFEEMNFGQGIYYKDMLWFCPGKNGYREEAQMEKRINYKDLLLRVPEHGRYLNLYPVVWKDLIFYNAGDGNLHISHMLSPETSVVLPTGFNEKIDVIPVIFPPYLLAFTRIGTKFLNLEENFPNIMRMLGKQSLPSNLFSNAPIPGASPEALPAVHFDKDNSFVVWGHGGNNLYKLKIGLWDNVNIDRFITPINLEADFRVYTPAVDTDGNIWVKVSDSMGNKYYGGYIDSSGRLKIIFDSNDDICAPYIIRDGGSEKAIFVKLAATNINYEIDVRDKTYYREVKTYQPINCYTTNAYPVAHGMGNAIVMGGPLHNYRWYKIGVREE